jgi:neopullulanase
VIRRFFLGVFLALLIAPDMMAQSYRDRLPEDEVIYFLLPDRFENGDMSNDKGGLKGDRLKTGYDPTAKGFYHGGDLNGLISRLDYIQGLGATAVWLAPVFKNKPVQGAPGQESAGYHGYWITDFTTVDPHFGTEADFKAFVNAAHARGMKIYMDIITNHTADVIRYRECEMCVYRNRADYPGNAYTPFIPKGQEHVKKPAWLNDISLYHNRGDTTYWNESATMGDFVGLDDIKTEDPRAVAGFIQVYGAWIDQYGIDGFRVDTARHVNPEFWQAFVPAMLARARERGIPNFHIFGEIGGIGLEPGKLAVHTRVDGFPAVIDFAFRQAVINTVADSKGTDNLWELFFGDPLYAGGEDTARRLPTFVSNHDNGRIGYFVRQAFPKASDDEVLKRVRLAHAMLLMLRGVPTIYAGDEQGFAGDGWDQDAREDMFPSRTAVYNDNWLIGTSVTTAVSNFDPNHPLYLLIAQLSKLRHDHAALRRGKQIVRNYSETPGLFAVSRLDPETGREIVIAFNTSGGILSASVEVLPQSHNFKPLFGTCVATARVAGSIAVSLAPFDFMICEATQ